MIGLWRCRFSASSHHLPFAFFPPPISRPIVFLLSKSSEPGDTSPTPPASPPTFRRGGTSREENPNVFSRLTHGTNVGQEPVPDRGVVHPFQGKVKKKRKKKR